MRRPTPAGTPSRSPRYVMPRAGNRLVLLSLAAAGALLAIGGGLYAAGVHRIAAPGEVAAGHAAVEGQCATCHEPAKAVADLRCERCHDPIDARRFGGVAHAALGGGSAWRAAQVGETTCAACHTEHGGRALDLQRVDDRRCASCHDFASFARHPEFAIVRASRQPSPGLDFSHEIHLREVARTGGERCQTCHQLTPDQRAFEPIQFDTLCATCHIKDGVLTLNGTDPLKGGFTPAALLLPSTPQRPAPQLGVPDERGRVVPEGMGHRDAWVVASAGRLTRAMSGPAVAAARARLADEITRVSAIAQAVPLTTLADADLAAWATSLDGEIAAIDRQIAQGPSAPAEQAAALETAAGALDPSLAALVSGVGAAQPPAAAAEAGRPAEAQQVTERRREVEQLLDAVSARTGSTGPLAARAAALRQRLADVSPGQATAAPDAAALADRVQAALAALAEVESAAGNTMTAELRALGAEVRQQVAGGLGPAAAAAERARLLALVDAASARATPPLRARLSELRMAVLSLPDPGADRLRARRDEKARLLERLRLEETLRGVAQRANAGRVASTDAIANAERTAAARDVAALQTRLEAIDGQTSALPDLDLTRGKSALEGLLGACLSCHRLDEDGTAMRPMAPAQSLLTAATFTHRPHLLQARCESCHASIPESKAGIDVSIPSVATCQSCHKPSQARADCAGCHIYHPQSAADMVRAAWR